MNRLGKPFSGTSPRRRRGKRPVAAAAAFAVVTSLFTPWAMSPADAAVGQGFNLNLSDVRFILKQIKIAEAHAASATPANPCGTLLGTGPNQIPNGNQQQRPLDASRGAAAGRCPRTAFPIDSWRLISRTGTWPGGLRIRCHHPRDDLENWLRNSQPPGRGSA